MHCNTYFRKAFTLVEILVVFSVLSILAATVPLTLNFKAQTGKAQDVRRKADLKTMATILTDYYNDNGKYPIGAQFCAGSVTSSDGLTCSCIVCGIDKASHSFAPYLSRLGCDPQYPQKTYLYQFDCQNQQWFRLCSALSTDTAHAFAYGVSSNNVTVDECKNISSTLQPNPTAIPTLTPTITPTRIISQTPVPTKIPSPSSTPPPGVTITLVS